jgi:hypothetical protein
MLLYFGKYKLHLVCNKSVTRAGFSAVGVGWVLSSFKKHNNIPHIKNKTLMLQIIRHKNWFRIAVLKRTQLLQKVL